MALGDRTEIERAVIDPLEKFSELMGLPPIRAAVEAAEGPVYLVGGTVRDLILGRPVHDYDLTVSANLEETARRAGQILGVRPIPMGRPPLTIHRLPWQGVHLDICPMEGGDVRADLLRRDLTINAVGLELTADKAVFLDPTGGLRDLDDKILRFVAEDNVVADPLRILRLFRFAAVLGFDIHPESLVMAARHAPLAARPAGERVREEILTMLGADKAFPALRAMHRAGVLLSLFPEMETAAGCTQGDHHHLDVLEHTLAAVEASEAFMAGPEEYSPEYAGRIRSWLDLGRRRALVKLTLLFHDLGKPETRSTDEEGRVRFLGHAQAGMRIAAGIAERLRLSNAEIDLIFNLIRHHLRLFHLMESRDKGKLTRRGIWRFGREIGPLLWGVVVHSLSDLAATKGPIRREKGDEPVFLDFLEFILEELDRQQAAAEAAPPLISGRDLIRELRLEPSPLIGRILDLVEEAGALGKIGSKEDALALAREIVVGAADDD
jgi:putative nucleotidyltransferase with HDIG domain